MTANTPYTILIEGNIGSGKSTLLNHFKKFEKICVVEEPVEKWRDCGGINLLVSFIKHFLRFLNKNNKKKQNLGINV
jgi:deoxyadenosine/deoxycytidine kinase